MADSDTSASSKGRWAPPPFAFALAWLGTLDSAWLLMIDASGVADVCSGAGCAAVLGSRYAHIAGVPLALLGLGFYTTLALGSAVRAALPSSRALTLTLSTFAFLGVATSAYLTWIQAFELHAYCPFCLASAATTVLASLALVVGRGPRPPLPMWPARLLILLELATATTGIVAWRLKAAEHARKLAPSSATLNVDVSHAFTVGSPNAPLRVVAFLDYDCAHCRETWQALSESLHRSTFRVAIFAYQLPGHSGSAMAIKAAEAANERGLFAPMHERLMTVPRFDMPTIISLAQQVGVPVAPLVARLQAPGDGPWLSASLMEARRLGVSSVPYVLVDGRPLPPPVTPALIEQQLARAP